MFYWHGYCIGENLRIILKKENEDKKCPLGDGQKMTDNQKVLGVLGRFAWLLPTYYRLLRYCVFLAWILHKEHQVFYILLLSNREDTDQTFIKLLPPFSKPISPFAFGFF